MNNKNLSEIIKADVEGKNKNKLFFQHPCTIQISGQSGSGKTVFLTKVLLDQNSPWEFIIYCYGVWQSKFDLLKKKLKDKIVFIKGVPEDEDRKMIEEFLKAQKDKTKGNIQTIIIFDDLMEELKKSEYFAQFYYSGCHHLNVSICCLTQNIFNNRTARLNCHYLQIHNFESDKSTVMNLGKQLMPNSSKKFVDMYNEALSKPYGFLMVDLKCKQNGMPELKYRNGSFDKIFLLE